MTTERAFSEDELKAYLDLEAWEVSQPKRPSIFQVIHTGDTRLIGAYVLREFRVATRRAVQENQRVLELRELAYLAFEVAEDAERFLRMPNLQLDGRTPLQAAMHSSAGRDQAIFQLAPVLRSTATRVLDRLAQVWELTDAQLSRLFRATPQEVSRWREGHEALPADAVKCVAVLLGISRALKTPQVKNLQPVIREGWMHRMNDEPPFYGQSALEFMVEGGLPAMQQVRTYLDVILWSELATPDRA